LISLLLWGIGKNCKSEALWEFIGEEGGEGRTLRKEKWYQNPQNGGVGKEEACPENVAEKESQKQGNQLEEGSGN